MRCCLSNPRFEAQEWQDVLHTILMVTHNTAQARRASEKCIFMLMGKVIEHTQTDEMFPTPRHEETADYITPPN